MEANYTFEDIGRFKLIDVHSKVIVKMIEMIEKAKKLKKTIIWDDFFTYCGEYFNLPNITIEECIPIARKNCNL